MPKTETAAVTLMTLPGVVLVPFRTCGRTVSDLWTRRGFSGLGITAATVRVVTLSGRWRHGSARNGRCTYRIDVHAAAPGRVNSRTTA
jgi:hypothetical protein